MYLDTEHPDDDMYIAYCPSLNLVGYGNGEDKAKQDFQWMMSDYLCEMLRQGTLEEDLLGLGWKAKELRYQRQVYLMAKPCG